MLNFPVPYHEELLYSTVARAGVRQGLVSPKQLLDEIYESRGVVATLDLPSHLTAIARWLPDGFSGERLMYNHTLFPIYAPFVPELRRQQCIAWMLEGFQGAVHVALGVAASRVKTPRFFKYCPGCLQIQKKQYGEYFWKREWQIPGIDTCPEHGSLIDTRIIRTAFERHRFIAASPTNCPWGHQGSGSIASSWVLRQVRQLLARPSQQSPSFHQWSHYYQSLARAQGICRGNQQIDHLTIQERILRAWPTAWLTRNHLKITDQESGWQRAIFRKHRKSFSYLQHIVVHQALLGDDWQINNVIDEASQYPAIEEKIRIYRPGHENEKKDLDQKYWLSLISTSTPKQARMCSPALYARLYRKHRDWLLDTNHNSEKARQKNSAPRLDWAMRDLECFQTLRELSIFLSSNKQGPRRSKGYYLKLLGNASTVEKNLHRMPLSEAYLLEQAESVPQYQMRRLQTAYDELMQEFDCPPRWRLMRRAGLSDERLSASAKGFLDCLEYKHGDDKIAKT